MEPEQLFLIFGIVAALFAAVIIAAAMCAALVMVMVTVGIVSVIVGLSTGKVLSALRALLVQVGVLAGAPLGALAAVMLAHVWPQISHHGVILVMGGATGAFAGLVMALLVHRAVQMATARLPKLRLPRTTLIPSS